MAQSLSTTRLAFKLAARDLRRYKGRSLLAALLIFVPVLAMAGLLTFLRTANVDGTKQSAQHLQASAASVEFVSSLEKPAVFPAAGKVVGTGHGQPTTEQVARQAHAKVTRESSVPLGISPAPSGPVFTPTSDQSFLQTDLSSPMVRPTVRLDSGRWPQKPGEVLVTRIGLIAGLPKQGPVNVGVTKGSYGDATTPAGSLTIVGTATSVTQASLLGPDVPRLASRSTTPTFLVAGSPWRSATVQQWQRYGAEVSTRSQSSADTEGLLSSKEDAVPVAIGTMGFIAVTALLAGPAFAASATRQRRTLGLIAANGATRKVLRRIVLAQALLLGLLTAAISIVLGAAIGCYAAKWAHLTYEGTPAPADIPAGWLVGVLVVSAVASLIAAAVPARSAGRTNLLAALRGQVSSRVVRKRWPLIGLAGIALGTLCLYGATTKSDSYETRGVLLSYIGVPLFFGGAVLAIPFFLLLTGRLAGRLPVTARIAVRDVSRQRTRATASVGAVLATTAVLCAASIFGASIDAFDKKDYQPTTAIGSGAFTTQSPTPLDEESEQAGLDKLPAVKKLVKHATPMWASTTDSGLPRLTAGPCTPKSTGNDPFSGTGVIALDSSDLAQSGLSSADQRLLATGGAVVIAGSPNTINVLNGADVTTAQIKNAALTLHDQNPSDDNAGITQHDCTPVTLRTTQIAHAPEHLGSAPRGTLIVTRDTLRAHHLPAHLWGISLDPETPMSTKTEHQVAALTPPSMHLSVERGYRSPLAIVLGALTAGFALIVLLTTIVSTLLNDAESQSDMATLAATGAPRGMRRRIVGAHAAAIGFIGAAAGTAVGFVPGLILARASTREWSEHGPTGSGTYAVSWWPILAMLILVPLLAALISMVFARRAPSLNRREA